MPAFDPEFLPMFARILYRRIKTQLDHRSWIVILYCGFANPIIRALLRDGWRPWAELGDNEFKFTLPWCGYGIGSLEILQAQFLWPQLMDHWVKVTLKRGIFEVFNTVNLSGLGIRATGQCLYYQMARSLDGHLDIITEDEEAASHTFGRLRAIGHNSFYIGHDEDGFGINGILWGPLSLVNSDVNFYDNRTQFVNQDRRGLDLRWRAWYHYGFEHFLEDGMQISSMHHSYDCDPFDSDEEDFPDYHDHEEKYNNALDTGTISYFYPPRVMMQTCRGEQHGHHNGYVAQQEVFVSYHWGQY